MYNGQILKKLASRGGLFISLYLPVIPGESKKEFLTLAHSKLNDLRRLSHNLGNRDEKYVGALIERIENYLPNLDTRNSRTLVIFCGNDFFKVFKLTVEIPTYANIENKPNLNPLSRALEQNPPYILVILDRTKAKLLEVNLLQEEAESRVIESDVPQRILAKGNNMGMESKILRHIEDHLHRHLAKVLRQLIIFEKDYPVNLIVIGAQKDLATKFEKLLPKSLANKVVGDFSANLDDNQTELIKKSSEIINSYLISCGKADILKEWIG